MALLNNSVANWDGDGCMYLDLVLNVTILFCVLCFRVQTLGMQTGILLSDYRVIVINQGWNLF